MPETVAPDGTTTAAPVATFKVLFPPVPVIESRDPHVLTGPAASGALTRIFEPEIVSILVVSVLTR